MQNTHWIGICVKQFFLFLDLDTGKKDFIISVRLSYDYWFMYNVQSTDYGVGVSANILLGGT